MEVRMVRLMLTWWILLLELQRKALGLAEEGRTAVRSEVASPPESRPGTVVFWVPVRAFHHYPDFETLMRVQPPEGRKAAADAKARVDEIFGQSRSN